MCNLVSNWAKRHQESDTSLKEQYKWKSEKQNEVDNSEKNQTLKKK